jgi:hypothetical protein
VIATDVVVEKEEKRKENSDRPSPPLSQGNRPAVLREGREASATDVVVEEEE